MWPMQQVMRRPDVARAASNMAGSQRPDLWGCAPSLPGLLGEVLATIGVEMVPRGGLPIAMVVTPSPGAAGPVGGILRVMS